MADLLDQWLVVQFRQTPPEPQSHTAGDRRSRTKARIVVAAPEMAIARRCNVAGFLLRLYKGSQFRARKVHRASARYRMVGSMANVGAAADNAATESFGTAL